MSVDSNLILFNLQMLSRKFNNYLYIPPGTKFCVLLTTCLYFNPNRAEIFSHLIHAAFLKMFKQYSCNLNGKKVEKMFFSNLWL